MKDYNYFIDCLSKLISYRSVKQDASKSMPFGKGVYDAYSYFMSLAKDMGFETVNYDNYIGEITYGNGQEIGIIGHLDVVPEGTGWNTDPYTLTKIDDKFYARGIADDKAPVLLCLFILNELKESGIRCNKRFRFIIGCDEESGWQDIDYFKTKSTFPTYGFSPDGNFPVSYAEKGINEIIFTLPKLKNFSNVKGGTVFNAVCGYCTCVANDDGINLDLLQKHGLSHKGNVIESVGKSCHGSRPNLGKNAIEPLFNYFLDMGEDVSNVCEYLFQDKAGLKNILTPQGDVTFSPDIIEEVDGKVVIHCDCRVPAPKKLEDLFPIFDSFKIPYFARKQRDPLYVPKDGKFVQTLLNAYNQATGETGRPISQSGGTFAYVFDRGCAFGPEFENRAGSIHEPNENMSEEDLFKLYEIYKKAIFDLAVQDDFD